MKDILEGFAEWRKYLWRKWKVILIVGIVGGVLGCLYAVWKNPRYEAQLTFILDEDKSNPMSAAQGLASQFGVELGSSGQSGIFSGENIMEFLQSRLMVEQALLTDIPTDNGRQTLADLFIQTYKLPDHWKKKPQLAGFSFPLNIKPEALSRLQDSVLHLLYTTIIKKNLVIDKPDKKLDFISVTTTSESEVFSKVFTERLVGEAADFYIMTKTQRSQNVVDKMQQLADSVLGALNKQTYRSAEHEDLNLNPARKLATVQSEFNSRDKSILQSMYEDVDKNLETAKANLLEQTPAVRVVDTPRYPLTVLKIGYLVGILIGSFVLGFLCCCWLVARKVVKDAMA